MLFETDDINNPFPTEKLCYFFLNKS